MGTRVSQFSSLLSGYVDPNTGLPGAGYTVYFYAAGTTTAKDVWTAYDKTGGAVTSVVLDATGSALVFGDGVYKLVVKNLSAATVDTFDGVKTQFSGYDVTTSTAATLAVTTDMDAVLLDCTSTNQVVTLPLASASTRPIFFKRICAGSNTITISATSPDTIDGATSVSLASLNTDVTLVSDGANWYGQAAANTNADTLSGYSIGTAVNTIPLRGVDGYIPGASPIATETVPGVIELATQDEVNAGSAVVAAVTPETLLGLFNGAGRKSFAASGYQKLPGGLIVQWGFAASIPANGTVNITFPIAFPVACLNAQGTRAIQDNGYINLTIVSATTLTLKNVGGVGDDPAYWFAIGY